MQYVEGSIDWFHNCNSDTWSILWVEDFLRQLKYVINDKLTVYWCLPGKDFSDGLVELVNDAHIVDMIGAVKENKIMQLYVDRTNFVKELRSDVLKHEMEHKPSVHFDDATKAQAGMDINVRATSNERTIHATDRVVEIQRKEGNMQDAAT
jgi:hypothetical protein